MISTGMAALVFRQFTRAVTGDPLVGDTVTAGLLAGLDADRIRTLDFFISAMQRWRHLAAAPPGLPFARRRVLAEAFGADSLSRQAGILTDLHGWGPAEGALILGIGEADYVRYLSLSRMERAAPLDRCVLIVEDDPIIATRLQDIARGEGASVVEVAHNHRAALEKALEMSPDLLVADHDLGPGQPTGLDVMRDIDQDLQTLTVFVTAHPEAVLTGGGDEPAFVLSKPYREEALAASLHFAASAVRPVPLAA